MKIGILGTADITSSAILSHVNKVDNVDVIGIASRDRENSRLYASKYNIPKYFEGYANLLECEDIELVYIPLVNSLHSEWICKSLRKNKDVLVEKPICLNSNEIKDIRFCLKNNPRVVIEANMMQYHEFISDINKFAAKYQLGKPIQSETILCCPTNYSASNYRFNRILGGGILYDEGVYWLAFVQALEESLDNIKTFREVSLKYENNIDIECSIELEFNSGFRSKFFSSYNKPLKGSYRVIFENGSIYIKNFLRPVFGYNSLVLEIFDTNNKSIEKVKYPRQSYYHSQLANLGSHLKGENIASNLNMSFSRVKTIEEIYEHTS